MSSTCGKEVATKIWATKVTKITTYESVFVATDGEYEALGEALTSIRAVDGRL